MVYSFAMIYKKKKYRYKKLLFYINEKQFSIKKLI